MLFVHQVNQMMIERFSSKVSLADEPEILLELVYTEPISTDSECTAYVAMLFLSFLQLKSLLDVNVLVDIKFKPARIFLLVF